LAGGPRPARDAGPGERNVGRVRVLRRPRLALGAARLLNDVRQQGERAGALDRLRELALLLDRNRRDAARHDLAALGNEALEQLHVLVVDLRRVRTGERAGLAPAVERAADGQLTDADF